MAPLAGSTGNPMFLGTDLPDSGVGGTLKTAVIASVSASGTDITLTDLAPHDRIRKVLEFTKSGGNLTGINDVTERVMLLKANAFQLSGASTSGNVLVVDWLDQQP